MQNPKHQYHTIINDIPQITIYSSETYSILIEPKMNAIIKIKNIRKSTIINIIINIIIKIRMIVIKIFVKPYSGEKKKRKTKINKII